MGMTVRVLYFGMLAEALGIQEESIDLAEITTELSLAEYFRRRHLALKYFQFSIAVNQELCTHLPTEVPVHEIAILPPFAGG
jgi:molybdopterin converting factor small subunit